MKRSFLGISLCVALFICFTKEINAKTYYFKNDNNVKLSEKEYNFISELYWNGYQNIISQEQYNTLKKENIFDKNIETTFSNNIVPLDSSVSDSAKTLKISKVCNTNCTVVSTLTWNGVPNIRSYDVMGVYFTNTELKSTPLTVISSSNTSDVSTESKSSTNGYGVSFKLPSSGTNIKITQTYSFSKGGTINASYQHAKYETTLTNSKNYTFSETGYGKVFLFNETSAGIYDRMPGVEINL